MYFFQRFYCCVSIPTHLIHNLVTSISYCSSSCVIFSLFFFLLLFTRISSFLLSKLFHYLSRLSNLFKILYSILFGLFITNCFLPPIFFFFSTSSTFLLSCSISSASFLSKTSQLFVFISYFIVNHLHFIICWSWSCCFLFFRVSLNI